MNTLAKSVVAVAIAIVAPLSSFAGVATFYKNSNWNSGVENHTFYVPSVARANGFITWSENSFAIAQVYLGNNGPQVSLISSQLGYNGSTYQTANNLQPGSCTVVVGAYAWSGWTYSPWGSVWSSGSSDSYVEVWW